MQSAGWTDHKQFCKALVAIEKDPLEIALYLRTSEWRKLECPSIIGLNLPFVLEKPMDILSTAVTNILVLRTLRTARSPTKMAKTTNLNVR
jgi:hypothetical protein